MTSSGSYFIVRELRGPVGRGARYLMVSLSCRTARRRRIRAKKAGKENTKLRLRAGTPKFPIQPPDYDPTAPDAKKL